MKGAAQAVSGEMDGRLAQHLSQQIGLNCAAGLLTCLTCGAKCLLQAEARHMLRCSHVWQNPRYR